MGLGIRGSHYTCPILFRARWLPLALLLPRILGITRFPISLLGVAGAVAIVLGLGPAIGWPLPAIVLWIWLVSPLTLLPVVPTTIRFRLGPPIFPAQFFDADTGDGEEAPDVDPASAEPDRGYERVLSAVQALVRT